ncbi:DUF1107 family protein [Vibrio marisflavi]|uniref:DUF1107 domain-containing protein n=1 Tax=Vibrio marisflavi CECT 7928 TaxID=634439 RepID=A0ABN8EAJ4_9VIBR|nr:DUF1107 family protein [Vibrio marisflavi]CAH0541612.1 hypothetical protein VMF7928_03677 [Vibrio marisflavi CECT 7928]
MYQEFSVYRPHQVARYVKRLFKGTFFITGIGEFQFDNGKVLVPEVEDSTKLNAFREINKEIAALPV